MHEKNVGKAFLGLFFGHPYLKKSTKTHVDGALLNVLMHK